MNVTFSGTPLKKIADDLNHIDVAMLGYIERVALLARGYITERLETHLGTSAEHFMVTIRHNSFFGYTITIGPKDDVGVFLMKGTEPHTIMSDNPMPVGNGQYATVVHHPGFKGKEDIIRVAIFEGMTAALETA